MIRAEDRNDRFTMEMGDCGELPFAQITISEMAFPCKDYYSQRPSVENGSKIIDIGVENGFHSSVIESLIRKKGNHNQSINQSQSITWK